MTAPPHLLDPAPFAERRFIPETVYHYVHADCSSAGAVARFARDTLSLEAKEFRQWRWSGLKFALGLNGQKLPLYRLPEVRHAIETASTVFIVEGEKCVNVVFELGLVATCNAGGADKWLAEHTESLRGADVVVLADNDLPGRKHADAVCTALVGVAKRVRRLDLPGLAPKGDVAEWVAAGGTREELERLAAAAPEWKGSAAGAAAGDEPWPEPILFAEASEPEKFNPTTMLPSPLSEIAAGLALAVRVDVASPGVLLPIVMSVAAGNLFAVQVSASHREPCLARHLCISARSGERKSELFRRTTLPLNAWTMSRQREYEQARAQYLSDLSFYTKLAEAEERKAAGGKSPLGIDGHRDKARDARSKIPRPPRSPDLFIGDTTSEALVLRMAAAGGAYGVCSADARQVADCLLGQYRRDGKTDDAVYLKGHAGDVLDRGRVGNQAGGERLAIQHPSLAVGICLQPDKVVELVTNATLTESGFLARLHFVEPRSLIGERIETGDELPLDPALAERLERLVGAILDFRWQRLPPAGDQLQDLIVLQLSPEAQRLRREFHNEIEIMQRSGGPLAGQTGFASKAAGETARLAALFHLAILADAGRINDAALEPISADTWRLAEAHQRWQMAETLRVAGLGKRGLEERVAQRVLAWAAADAAERRVVSARVLIGAHQVDDVASATRVMQWLRERGWVRELPPGGRERAPRWQFHPAIFVEGGR